MKKSDKMVLSMKVFSDFWFDHRKYRFWYLLVPRKCEKCVFFILFWMLKWSNGVGENEIIIIWCLSTTYNVKTCQKFNEIAEMTKSWKVPGLLHCASYHISNGNSRVSHTPPPRISLEISGKFENAQIKRGKRIPGGIGGKMVSSMTRLQVEGRC